MPDEDVIKSAGTAVNVVAALIKAAGDNEHARAAGSNLGKAAVTVTAFINNALLPIAAINFSMKKARDYFEGQFGEDMKGRIDQLPNEAIVEPKASIAGPALQGLAFSFEEPSLKELYLNLLASAMDGRTPELAHPAFVEVLKQLTSREADLLRMFCGTRQAVAIVKYQATDIHTSKYSELQRHTMDWHDDKGNRAEMPSAQVFIDNWIRLGLVTVDYMSYLTEENLYAYATERPEYARHVEAYAHRPERKIDVARGSIRSTDFGYEFGEAVGLREKVATPQGETSR